MVTLGGVALGYDIIWTDRHQSDGVYQSITPTAGGGQRITVQAKTVGHPVTLEATDQQGWIASTLVPILKEMASQPDVAYDFDFHGLESFQVMFRHYEPPALALRPLIDGAEYGEWFIGTIKLFTV